MEPQIVEKPQMMLLGLSFFGDPFSLSAGWTEENEIGRLWKRFMAYLAEQGQQGLEPPSVLYVDGAYVHAQALQEAEAQGRALRGPAPASPDRGKTFPVDQFDVHVAERHAVCPAGQRSTNCSRLQDKKTGRATYRIEWNDTVCKGCSLRRQCLSDRQTHRTIVVGEWHSLLQARRREMQTEAFQRDMHHRNGIEGTQSELIRAYGLRRARYRSLEKVRLQNYVIGAACNLRRLFRRMAWEVRQGLRPEGSITAIMTA